MQWEVVIGLETHTQLSTVSKIFSGASTAFGAAPNTQAAPVDLALPGVLPVLNKGAVERAIVFGLEPVFAALTAWVLLGESLGWAGASGAALIVAALVFSQVQPAPPRPDSARQA